MVPGGRGRAAPLRRIARNHGRAARAPHGGARLPNVTIQVVPNIAHAGLLGGFAITEAGAAYVETAVAGQVFEDAEIIARLAHPLRYAQERGAQGVRVPGIDRADVRGMESNWRKSSYSGANGGECVEVAAAGAVMVRDTTDRSGPMLDLHR